MKLIDDAKRFPEFLAVLEPMAGLFEGGATDIGSPNTVRIEAFFNDLRELHDLLHDTALRKGRELGLDLNEAYLGYWRSLHQNVEEAWRRLQPLMQAIARGDATRGTKEIVLDTSSLPQDFQRS